MNNLTNFFSNKKFLIGDSIPVEGKFEKGDLIINIGSGTSSTPMWICTEGGEPGEWAPVGAGSKYIMEKSLVVISEEATEVEIGIGFDANFDTLLVFINDGYATKGVDYLLENDKIKVIGNEPWNETLTNDFTFEFIVFKNILEANSYSDLTLNPDQIGDGTITSDKLEEGLLDMINAIDPADLASYQTATDNDLVTTDKTIVGAINELFQNVDNGKQLIADVIDDEAITKDSTFTAISEAITNTKQKLVNALVSNSYPVSIDNSWDELISLVSDNINIIIPCTSITTDINELNITALSSEKPSINYTLSPSDTTEDITYTMDDREIAFVSQRTTNNRTTGVMKISYLKNGSTNLRVKTLTQEKVIPINVDITLTYNINVKDDFTVEFSYGIIDPISGVENRIITKPYGSEGFEMYVRGSNNEDVSEEDVEIKVTGYYGNGSVDLSSDVVFDNGKFSYYFWNNCNLNIEISNAAYVPVSTVVEGNVSSISVTESFYRCSTSGLSLSDAGCVYIHATQAAKSMNNHIFWDLSTSKYLMSLKNSGGGMYYEEEYSRNSSTVPVSHEYQAKPEVCTFYICPSWGCSSITIADWNLSSSSKTFTSPDGSSSNNYRTVDILDICGEIPEIFCINYTASWGSGSYQSNYQVSVMYNRAISKDSVVIAYTEPDGYSGSNDIFAIESLNEVPVLYDSNNLTSDMTLYTFLPEYVEI